MLSPDANVVRGGKQRDASILANRIEDDVYKGLPAEISVWAHDALPHESRAETLLRIVEEAGTPHSRIQVARHSSLVDAGFALTLDTSNGQAPCHYNVAVSFPIDTVELESFISCFSEPEHKPTGTGGHREDN